MSHGGMLSEALYDAFGTGGGARLVDLGIVSVLDLLDGPKTIYTPALNSYVQFLLAPIDFETLSVPGGSGGFGGALKTVQSSFAEDGGQVFPSPAPYTDWAHCGMNADESFLEVAARFTGDAAKPHEQIRYPTPVQASYLAGNDGFPIRSTPPGWQAAHAYDEFALILGADDHYWAATTAGTSGGSEPDFAANEGGTVTDGSVEWTDEGGIPAAGQFHLWALVIAAPTNL